MDRHNKQLETACQALAFPTILKRIPEDTELRKVQYFRTFPPEDAMDKGILTFSNR
jgi:hypothetical protein